MTQRAPDATRARILEAAAREIHARGFQAASLDAILEDTGLTKGALYHHFASKEDLCGAVVGETIDGYLRCMWVDPIAGTDDPIPAIVETLERNYASLSPEVARCGCPLNNLNQEMSARSEALRQAIDAVYVRWHEAIVEAFARGQRAGNVRKDVSPGAIATFVLAVHQGAASLMKAAGTAESIRTIIPTLIDYLETLRPSEQRSPSR